MNLKINAGLIAHITFWYEHTINGSHSANQMVSKIGLAMASPFYSVPLC